MTALIKWLAENKQQASKSRSTLSNKQDKRIEKESVSAFCPGLAQNAQKKGITKKATLSERLAFLYYG